MDGFTSYIFLGGFIPTFTLIKMDDFTSYIFSGGFIPIFILFIVWCRFITYTIYLLYGVGLLPTRQYLFKSVARVYRPHNCLYFYLKVWSRISANTRTFTLLFKV
ncbi:unnamed protein product [Prunus brigantina]